MSHSDASLTPSPPPERPPFLHDLNPEQRAAVTAGDGPLLVLAGAGTGKTRVLTTRLAHLLVSRRARPHEVLAVTFTNKAAREMRERLERMVGRAVDGMWLGTFHAIGVRILRRHAEVVGLKQSFTILDTDDQLRLLKQVIAAANLDERRWPPRGLLALISRWKDRGLTPEQVPAAEATDFALGRGVELYRAYQDRLLTLNAADFGDLLLHGLTLFARAPDVLARYQERFRAILVDEYQDTNVAQYLWLRLLAQKHRNVTCVGDDDQSVYSWRGAEVGNILRFERDFPGAAVVRLEQNYRSTGHILGAASGLIARNESRLGKTLWTEGEAGERVRVCALWDDQEEARFIGEQIEAHQRGGGRLNDVAVLVRAGFQTRAFEERFIATGLPYRVIGGPRFYERAEIRDAVAYLRVIAQPDDDLAFERIVNRPKRGLGEATLQLLSQTARAAKTSLVEAAHRLRATDELRPQARTQLGRLLDALERWRRAVPTTPPGELAGIVLEESGYVAMWQADRSPDAAGRLENLKEFVKAVAEFDALAGFLEHIGLVMDNASDPAGDMASIMTLHGAKGLEFDHVFLPGWEEGLFPNQRALDEGGMKALEEERRLAYVGLTRARRSALVTFAANRRIYNQWASSVPSRFVEELPAGHVEFLHRQLWPEHEPSGLFDEPDGGPGRREPRATRFRTLRAKDGPVIEGRAERVATAPPRAATAAGRAIEVGNRVFHQKFGYGHVATVEGNKLEIRFDKAGTKKVIDSFVELA